MNQNEFRPPARRPYQVAASVREEIAKRKSRDGDKVNKPLDFAVKVPLESLAAEGRRSLFPEQTRITMGLATCGHAAGALPFYRHLSDRDWEDQAVVVSAGCLGACYAEPLAGIRTPEGRHYFYGRVDSRSLWDIIRTAQGEPPSHRLWAIAQERRPGVLESIHDLELVKAENVGFAKFFRPQARRITGRCGLIDPLNINEYAASGGYQALQEALFRLGSRRIIDLVEASGLRGRGGAGFSTGEKWALVSQGADPVRFVIANADEGDPGAYMDRALMESDPHGILEGLIISAYAIGASRAYIFVRHEYPLAVRAMRQAISSACKVGLLGSNIMGSSFSLEVSVVESAGAFVCGEETSLLQVMENRRGEPRLRPPYPSQNGLYGHPTLVNNVETLANIPWILRHGPEAFRELGTARSPGTKIFCLAGDMPRMGFVEVELGASTRLIVEDIGGSAEKSVKALHIGGPSGGIVAYRDFSLDYESVGASGASMGSGGLVALGNNRCMVDLSRHMVNFMARESCGKCAICRDGLPELEALLLKLCIGQGYESILEDIQGICQAIAATALCGLGQTAANPVISSLKDFPVEYQAHVMGRCPAVNCKPLIDFEIDLASCRDCRACWLACPSEAVKMRSGQERFVVDQQLCSKCWACYETCPFDCIRITSEEFSWRN